MTTKTKTYKIGNIKRTVTKTFDPNHYANSTMAGVIYGGKNIPIKKDKTVVTTKPKKTITKVVKYSPVDYYGRQTRTKTKSRTVSK